MGRPAFLIFWIAILSSQAVHACLWEYATSALGKAVVVNGMHSFSLFVSYRDGAWEEKLKSNSEQCDLKANFKACNDQAVALIHLGRAKEAIPLLETLEKERPGTYQTAVNLGTALELAGQDENALKWISEGIRRNPESHQGTEWLHLRILEAKLALAKNPDWLRSHSPLDGEVHGPTGNAASPEWRAQGVAGTAGRELPLKEVRRAIEYQLTERLQFVKPPEPIVGELMLELASLVALDDSVERALPVLKQAKEFRPVRAELLALRTAHFRDLIGRNAKSGKSTGPGGDSDSAVPGIAGALVLLAAVSALIWGLRRRAASRRRLS